MKFLKTQKNKVKFIIYIFFQYIQLRHLTVILIMFNKTFRHYFITYVYVQNVTHKFNKSIYI